MSVIYSWKTRVIDFDQAYTQADCDAEIYLNFPQGFRSKIERKLRA